MSASKYLTVLNFIFFLPLLSNIIVNFVSGPPWPNTNQTTEEHAVCMKATKTDIDVCRQYGR